MAKQRTPLIASFAEEERAGDIATRSRSIDWYNSLGATLPNPDEVLKKLGVDIGEYKKLLSDPRVQAATTSRKAGSVAREWELTVEGVPKAQYDIIRSTFEALDMEQIIKEILDAVLYGYKPLEISWQKQGDLILPSAFTGKPPDWFRFGDSNELRFLTKTNMVEGEEVPPRKFVVAQNDASYENPYGTPVLSACYWPVKFRHNGYRFWTTFLEKYGMPWIIAKAAPGDQEDRINQVATMLENMVQDAIAVVPSDYEVEMKESSRGDASDSYAQYMDAASTEISIAILGTNLTTEVKGGSYAAAKSHMEVREDIIDADVRVVSRAFNILIRYIYEINWGVAGKKPEFYMAAVKDVDKDLAERDAILSQVGVKFTPEYVGRAYDLQPDVDFTMAGSTVDPAPSPSPAPTVDPVTEDDPDIGVD